MSDRLTTANASHVSGADFARSIGLRVRTKAQRLAAWQADIERYANWIEAGDDWAVPPPSLHDARLLVEGRKRARAA